MKWFVKYLLLSLALFGAVWFLYSCRENPEESISVAAVGEETFSLWDLRHYFPENADSLDRVRALRVISKWVDQTILYQAALDIKVDQDERVQTLLENARRKILVDQLLNRVRAQIEEPREGEIIEYYQKNQGEFKRNYPVYKVLYIREEGGRRAWDLRDDIKRLDFNRVYSKVTDQDVDESQLAYVPAEKIPQCLHEDLEKLEPGRTGWPKKCDNEYMILHLYDTSPAGESFPLEKVRSEVVERIMSEKAEARVGVFLDSLKTISVVFTYPENLPGGKAAMIKSAEKTRKMKETMDQTSKKPHGSAGAENSEAEKAEAEKAETSERKSTQENQYVAPKANPAPASPAKPATLLKATVDKKPFEKASAPVAASKAPSVTEPKAEATAPTPAEKKPSTPSSKPAVAPAFTKEPAKEATTTPKASAPSSPASSAETNAVAPETNASSAETNAVAPETNASSPKNIAPAQTSNTENSPEDL